MIETPKGVAFKCNKEGEITEIIRDDFEILYSRSFRELFDQENHKKSKNFIDKVISESAAYHWLSSIPLPTKDNIMHLYFSGILDKDTILIIGVLYKEHADMFYQEIMQISNQSSAELRTAMKKLTQLSKASNFEKSEKKEYNKITELNNELINLQRELVKKNQKINELYKGLENEIEKAKKIHYRLLPTKLPDLDNYSIAVYSQPNKNLGGDSYYFIVQDNKLIFYLSDVTGHSIDATMFTSFLKEAISSYITIQEEYNKNIKPNDIIHHLTKQYLKENFPEDYFICIFVGVLELNKHLLEYSSAGFHSIPYLMSKNNKKTSLKLNGLPISNVIDKDLLVYDNYKIEFQIKDSLFITTDGLEEQLLNKISYKNYLGQNLNLLPHISANEGKRKIIQDFKEKMNVEKGDDDITFTIIKREK